MWLQQIANQLILRLELIVFISEHDWSSVRTETIRIAGCPRRKNEGEEKEIKGIFEKIIVRGRFVNLGFFLRT